MGGGDRVDAAMAEVMANAGVRAEGTAAVEMVVVIVLVERAVVKAVAATAVVAAEEVATAAVTVAVLAGAVATVWAGTAAAMVGATVKERVEDAKVVVATQSYNSNSPIRFHRNEQHDRRDGECGSSGQRGRE